MGQVLTMGYIYSFNPYNNILKGNDYPHFIDKKMELKKKKTPKNQMYKITQLLGGVGIGTKFV